MTWRRAVLRGRRNITPSNFAPKHSHKSHRRG
jgi:hypothetical protein